jgi:holo-[acyl-carrier protein] synthase
MILGVGVDVCAVPRMARELAREGGGFRDAVFTPAEVLRCDARADAACAYALHYAAKEAAWKALGGAPDAGALRDAELRADPAGALHLAFRGRARAAALARGVTRAHLSLTSTDARALAAVVLEAADAAAMEDVRADL